jgi:uncharacterized protein YdeI (YjbR/CyaY-like superfamily)
VKPRFFPIPANFRAWLETHHADTPELWVGFYKRDSGKPSITWQESVDEALCFGWIDGLRKSLGDDGYMIRFTPRKPGSNWSAVNLKRAAGLVAAGRMSPAGLKEFHQRKKSRVYSYEQRKAANLEPAHQRQFRASQQAWAFFRSRPPWYQRLATYWVVTAKRPETRLKRLATLIDFSARSQTIRQLSRPAKTPPRQA